MKAILSLFDFTGSWSKPYRDNGYDVIQVDVKHGQNVYTLDIDRLPAIHGVLAAPPCTDFAVSGARWFKQKDSDGRTFESIALIYKTLSIIWRLKHRDNVAWWVLENPVGRIETLVPELKTYRQGYFQPNEFGHTYTKKTGLWGEFVFPVPIFIGRDDYVEPVQGSMMWAKYGGASERTKTARSVTPSGFAQAFYDVNR